LDSIFTKKARIEKVPLCKATRPELTEGGDLGGFLLKARFNPPLPPFEKEGYCKQEPSFLLSTCTKENQVLNFLKSLYYSILESNVIIYYFKTYKSK
jgi:hypothetical protein